MADIPGEGFDVGAAYVSVTPEAGDFQGEVEAIVGETDIIVNVPVVPDAEGFRARLEEEVTAGDTVVEVPVVPDTAGFKMLLQDELAGSREPVQVPVEPDAAGFGDKLAAETEPGAAAAGEEAGATFGERFSAVAGRMEGITAAIPGLASEAEVAGASTGESFMSRLKGVVSGDMPVMEVLLGAGFVAATAVMASSFQSAMEKIHTQAGVGQSAIAGLSSEVLSLASKVGESPDSLAQALYHIESSFQSVGITGSKAMQLLQTASEGARVGGSDLVDTTNALDAVIASGIGGVQNYSQAMGALNAIVGSGDMTMQDLVQAMGSGLMAVAKSYGQTLPEIGAALATFGDNNIRGAKAATDLRMAMQAMEAPMKTGADALQHLGLSMTDLGTTMEHHGIVAAIGQFVEHLKASKVPVDDWGRYVTEIFGKKAGAGIGVLIDQLSRLQGKLPDITRSTHNFGNAWAATQKTASQQLHEMEAGFQALMIRIGSGLLPALTSLFAMIARNLPAIEKFGSSIAHMIAPEVKDFFTGLHAILSLLFGPLKAVTLAVGGLTLAFIALDAVNPVGWVVLAVAGLVALVGAIIRYRKDIENALSGVVKWIQEHWVLAGAALLLILGPFGLIIAAVIKFHKQIVDALEKTWKDVTKTFDAFKHFVTSSFDSWWASHGKELEQVWSAVWGAITSTIKTAWGDITSTVASAWQLVGPYLKTALTVLEAYFKVVWAEISLVVKVAWDTMAAIVKVAVAQITAIIKVAWDVIVGIFNVALDLITGHWSQAWHDAEAMVEQVFNAIRAFFGSFWSAVSSLFTQDVNSIKSFLSAAWNAIQSAVVSAFDNIRHDIAAVWDGIISDALGFISRIEGAISGLGSAITSIPGKLLHGIGLAAGGIVPGSGGGDHVAALLTPGETVVSKSQSRLLAPIFGAVGVPGYGGGGLVGSYGSIRKYAGGGVIGWDGAAPGTAVMRGR